MRKFQDFNDIKQNMINPLDNPDFYAILIGDDRYSGYMENNGSFSMCHNYDLGSTTHDNWVALWQLAIKEYLNNTTYEKYRKKYCRSSEKDFEELKENLKKISIRKMNLKDKSPKNIEALIDLLGVGHDAISETGEPYRTSWFYFRSANLNPELPDSVSDNDEIKHRLYLTMDTESRVKMSEKIMGKCNERKLPYYFKIHINFNKMKKNQQSDTIVMYLADENQVVEYVNFINEIFDENKELKSHTHKTPPHLGIIDDYIGYGFEPKLQEGRTSYSKLLKDAVGGRGWTMAKDIFSFLADKRKRLAYDSVTLEGVKYWSNINLESPERYQKMLELLKKKNKTPEDYEMIQKCLSSYFKRENLKVDQIYALHQRISGNLIKLYPNLPEDNMFNIDVNEIKYELSVNEAESRREQLISKIKTQQATIKKQEKRLEELGTLSKNKNLEKK